MYNRARGTEKGDRTVSVSLRYKETAIVVNVVDGYFLREKIVFEMTFNRGSLTEYTRLNKEELDRPMRVTVDDCRIDLFQGSGMRRRR